MRGALKSCSYVYCPKIMKHPHKHIMWLQIPRECFDNSLNYSLRHQSDSSGETSTKDELFSYACSEDF